MGKLIELTEKKTNSLMLIDVNDIRRVVPRENTGTLVGGCGVTSTVTESPAFIRERIIGGPFIIPDSAEKTDIDTGD